MNIEIKEQCKLSDYTTIHLGGIADYLVEVSSIEELKAALQFAREQTATPPLVIGGGSNILFADEGYRGLVIVNRIAGYRIAESENEAMLMAGAGEILDDVVRRTAESRLWGLENLSSIPGSVGATPVQNVGAYGVEVSSLIKEVKAIHSQTLEEKTFANSECRFSYRDSYFKTPEGKEWIVVEVIFKLRKNFSPILHYGSLTELSNSEALTPAEVRTKVQEIRSEKFPDWNEVGTAGSFFKNPIISKNEFEELQDKYPEIVGHKVSEEEVKVSLGWILDKVCNLRGYCEGNVCLYEKQALVLVVEKGASATEVNNFVKKITGLVFEKIKIKIEPEVLILK